MGCCGLNLMSKCNFFRLKKGKPGPFYLPGYFCVMLLNENILEFSTADISIQLNLLKNKKTLYIFRAINHPLRLKILDMLHQQQKLTVTELYKGLKIEQAVVSQHLAILRRAGFVLTKRQGRQIYYTIHYDKLKKLTHLVNEFLGG